MELLIGWGFFGLACPLFLELKRMHKNPNKNVYSMNKYKDCVEKKKKILLPPI